ncbi:MAG: putative porin [Thiomargarita sp.]|nr:putative porin [Thiomargarita sp.]
MDQITNRLRQASFSILATSIFATGAMTIPSIAQADLSLSGDFRFRLESDFDSVKSDGITEREDRTRARIRARLRLNYEHNDWASFAAQMRSGSDDSHQSPNITIVDFDDNDTGDLDFNLDKWYFKAKKGGLWTWVGRNNMPFWKQNELFWSDFATVAGMATGFKAGGNHQFAINAGYFSLPVGMKEFSGNLALGQAVFSSKFSGGSFTAAAGLLSIEANADDDDAIVLLNQNGLRDYQIWVGSLQAKFMLGSLPLTIGGDWIHNEEDYSATGSDKFAAENRDETEGYVGSIHLGQTKNPGDWQLGYYYAHIETLAVNASYAHDDWARWGTATEGRLSNIKGHEFRFKYKATKEFGIVARLYVVKAITTDEDGNRFRLDFNYKF